MWKIHGLYFLQKKLVYSTAALLIVNPMYGILYLNSNSGVTHYFQYTNLFFCAQTTVLFVLVLRYITLVPLTAIFSIAVLYINYITPQVFKFINFGFPNTGLLNPLSQYHPPMFFAGIIILSFKILTPSAGPKKIKRDNTPLVLIVSVLLSCWWANQELFWGSFWNWDPVEMSAAVILGTMAFLPHFNNHNVIITSIKKQKMWAMACTAAYFINRSPLANSVHKFSGSFLLKIDEFWFNSLKLFLIYYILWTYGKHKISFSRLYKPNILLFTLTTAMLLLILTETTKLLEVPDKLFYKSAIIALLLCCRIRPPSLDFGSKKIITQHLCLKATLAIFLICWENPTTRLYTERHFIDNYCTAVEDVCLRVGNTKGTADHVYSNYRKLSTKHQSIIRYNLGAHATKQTYSRPNTDVYFSLVTPQNTKNASVFFLI